MGNPIQICSEFLFRPGFYLDRYWDRRGAVYDGACVPIRGGCSCAWFFLETLSFNDNRPELVVVRVPFSFGALSFVAVLRLGGLPIGCAL